MPLNFVDMQTSSTRYFCFTKSICFRFSQTRYDINLVAARQHIEPQGISSAIAHIKNLARDLYRCGAVHRINSCQDTKQTTTIIYLYIKNSVFAIGNTCEFCSRFKFSYVEVTILIKAKTSSKIKITIITFFILPPLSPSFDILTIRDVRFRCLPLLVLVQIKLGLKNSS